MFGFLGAMASGLLTSFSTAIAGVTTAVNVLITGFNSLIAFLPTIISAFSALLPVIAGLGVAAASAYAALKLMQKLAPGLNNAIGKTTEGAGTKTMSVADSMSWLKSKFTGKENYTGYYEKLFSQESPEQSMLTEGFLGGVNKYLDPQYKEKRDRTNKNLRIQSDLRAQAALNQDISGREQQLKSLENVPDMIGSNGQLNPNSASIQREQLTTEIEQLKNKKDQFDKYLAAKSGAGLEGRWIESIMDKNTGEMINNPLADTSKHLSKEDYEKQTSSMTLLKDSNDELKDSIDKLNELMNTGQKTSSAGGGSLSTGPILTPNMSQNSAKPFQGNQQQFYDKAYTTLLSEAQKAGVKNPEAIAKLGAAQTSLETGYGKSLAGGNNYFGIKDFSGKNQKQATKEFINGKWVTINDSFRSYGSMEESAADYIRFLQKNKRYAGVLNANSAEEAIMAQGKTGYATDPRYAQKLMGINMRGDRNSRPSVSPLGVAQAISKTNPKLEQSDIQNNIQRVIPIPMTQPSPAPSMQVAMAGGSDQKQSAVNCTIDGSVRAACS
jgi:flagellum-specific peptidoglycan hydrolase FlgJ